MAHYMFRARYTQSGIQGLLKEGAASRTQSLGDVVASVGGHAESMYWSFGDEDFIMIAELPSNAAAAALATRVSSTGTSAVSTTVLLTADEVDAARAIDVKYRAPGA